MSNQQAKLLARHHATTAMFKARQIADAKEFVKTLVNEGDTGTFECYTVTVEDDDGDLEFRVEGTRCRVFLQSQEDVFEYLTR